MATGASYPAHTTPITGSPVEWAGTLTFDDSADQPATSQVTLKSYSFTFSTAGLAAGVALYTPAIGDIILDVGVVITTAFNGTTPKIDVGTFSSTAGLFAELATAAVDGTKVYAAVTDNTGLMSPNAPLWLSSAIVSIGTATGGGAAIDSWQLYVSAADPILVVASQTGAKGGTAIDSTAGAATVLVLAATPGAF